MVKRALVTGVTGQDGAYLTKFLLEKGYQVYGLTRRSSSCNTGRIDNIPQNKNFVTLFGDMTDHVSLTKVVSEIEPDEIYNLAAQSHVQVSFDNPMYTSDVDAFGVLRLLETLRILGLEETKVYQASTSELYGKAQRSPQDENTAFRPRSPYAIAKLFAYWTMVNYREAYDMYTVNGILFNHESPLRGENFVTRKITLAAARIKYGLQANLKLGNLDSKRDWGFAGDYVEAMWAMLQQQYPEDYVIATGENHSVREFVELAFKEVGFDIEWEGEADYEKGYMSGTSKALVEVDPAFYRPTEVETLIGDASKAEIKLGWKPKTKFKDLVKLMVQSDENLVVNSMGKLG